MTGPALSHFSEEDGITRFVPRPVAVPAQRKSGMDWLNGPLVWAIDDWHQPLYLFPRDCPRILVWPTEATTDDDRAKHWREESRRMIAYVEEGWLDRLHDTVIYRYALPSPTFKPLDDAGMWVSREAVSPATITALFDLPGRLAELDVLLQPVADLRRVRPIWDTTMHASGIRLRNAAQGWP